MMKSEVQLLSYNSDPIEYLKKWVECHNELASCGFTWASLMENDEWNQYMSLDVLQVKSSVVQEILEDTRNFTNLVQATYRLVMKHPEYFSMLGLPVDTWEVSSVEWLSIFSYFCRYDIIRTKNGNKFIEINSDTPTGYVESSIANRKLCELHGVASANVLEDCITKAWELIISDYQIPENETIFFTSLGWHDEDRQDTLFKLSNCPHPNKEYVAIEEIIVSEEGIFTPDGRKIKFLYRLYPIEFFIEDQNVVGESVGLTLLEHVTEGNVHLINPLSAFVTQSKALLVVMWEILNNKPHLYTKEEQEWVRRYVPRSYFSNEHFENEDYVVKPLLGREGGGVTIINNGDVVMEDRTPEYYNQKKIYQEYLEMPELTIQTWDGPYTGKLLIGSYMVGGETAGLFLRVGEKITGNLSMFVGFSEMEG